MKNIFNRILKIIFLLGAGLALLLGIKKNNVESEVKKSNDSIDKMSTPALVQLGNDIIRRNSNK